MALPALKFEPEAVLEERVARLDALTVLTINIDERGANIQKSVDALLAAIAFDRAWCMLMCAGIYTILARCFDWI